MQVVITGGAGFLGQRLARKLLQQGMLVGPHGTAETIEAHGENEALHRCEDARGLSQGTACVTAGSQVRAIRRYKDGALHGTARVWYASGAIQAEATYMRGVVRRFRTWHERGPQAEDWRYSGAEAAEVSKWDGQGNLVDQLQYRRGEVDGLWTKYWPDGTTRRRATWRAGRLEGEFIEWYEDGTPRARGEYASNVKVGVWRFWDRAGIMSVREY